MKRLQVFVFFALFLIVAGFAVVEAQDGTEAPVLPDEGTSNLDAPIIVAEDEPSFWRGIVTYLLGAASGVIATVTGVLTLVSRFKGNDEALAAIEWLGRSVPESALTQLNELGRTMRDAGEVLESVSDGKPNSPPDESFHG